MLWGALTQLAFAQTPLTLRIVDEYVAAGGWAQIKVYANQPTLITKGNLALDLDPQVFGPIERVGAFSANGDAVGLAAVDGTHVEFSFTSASGGIGQLPDVPVAVVRAPVLPNARSSGFVSLSLPSYPPINTIVPNYPVDAWTGPGDKPYAVTLVSGRASAGTATTIGGVSPGGGFQPAGTVVTITGTGFSDSMKMTATGLAFSSFKVISPTRVEATLASTGEITGTRFQIENLYSNTIDYFASPPSAVTSSDQYTIGAGAHAVLPFTEQQGTLLSFTRPVMAILQNPTVSPADVRVREAVSVGPVSSRHFTLAPGAIMTVAGPFAVTQYFIDSDTPLRMRQYLSAIGGVYIQPPAPASSDVPPVSLTASPNDFTVNYQTGGATPDPRMIRLYSYTGRFPGASLQVTGAPWLSVSQPDSSGTFSASFDPSGLAPGTYQGTITATPTVSSELSEFPVKAATVKVALIVSAQPTLIIQPTQVEPPANTTYYTPTSLAVKTNGTSAAFTATVKTNDGANWLSIDRTSGTTPATINVQANSTGLAGGYYSGKISVAGPVNTVETSVDLVIYPIPKPKMTITPAYSETREEGVGPPRLAIPLSVSNKTGPVTVQVSTDDGGKWLSATVMDQNTSAVVLTNIDPTALPAGTYHGTVTATAAGESASSRITIVILPKPRTLVRLSPSSFHFVTSVGVESPPQTLTIDSDGPAILNFSSPDSIRIKDDGGSPFIAPRTLTIAGFSTIPGTFTGNLTISNSFGSTSVPVTVDVAGSATTPPVLSSVVNAASHRPNALAPGEMITLRGIGIGPPPTGLQLDSQGRISANVATDTRVEINGQPAPVLYASPNQWNVIVPYEVADHSSATVRVLTYGAPSRVWTLPVAPAAPAIFTLSATGIGQGAVLNQDNTVNSSTNPAPAGTIVQIFGTGGGQSNPPSTTGSVTPSNGGGGNQAPVKVLFADTSGSVVYAGPAPGFASGALQVNAVVPAFGTPGTNKTVQLSLEINGVRSVPVDVTIR